MLDCRGCDQQVGYVSGFVVELLDIVDAFGNPTGETIDRKIAHRDGIRHRTSHVWLLRKDSSGEVEVLLQKRSATKDSNPGCYDVSSAGHIPAGCGFEESALRECEEELGIQISPNQLQYCFLKRVYYEKEFYGELFKDNQVSAVFYIWVGENQQNFSIQREELEAVVWMPLKKAILSVKDNVFPNCIDYEELEEIQRHIDCE